MFSARKITCILFVCGIAGMTGCRLKRELPVSFTDQTEALESMEDSVKSQSGEMIHVQSPDIDKFDISKLTQCFLGTDEDEAQKYLVHSFYECAEKDGYIPENDYRYEKDQITLSFSKTADLGVVYISYQDNREAAAACYASYDVCGYLYEGLGSSMEMQFPREDLDSVTREEAVKACEIYADACGYADADVSVFAMTKEALETVRSENHIEIGAPDPDYRQLFSEEESWKIIMQINDAEKNGDDELVQELQNMLNQPDEMQYIPWEKKDEAYLLVYRPYLNGLVVDGFGQMLTLVYVPKLGRVVRAEGHTPFQVCGVEERELISKEKALSAAMLSLGFEDINEIEILSITLVYSIRATQIGNSDPTMNPCWKIDYRHPNMYFRDSGSIRIDAVTGLVSQFSDPW